MAGRIKLLILTPIILTLILFCFGASRLFFSSSSVISRSLPGNTLPQSDSRTNVLLLGIDKRAPGEVQSGVLTDTIMLASIPHNEGKIVIVSIPRDLWIAEYRAKINEIYGMLGANDASAEALKKAVSGALGVPVHFQVQVGFGGFKEAVDTLGGVSIDVQNTFDDYRYPVSGRENDTCELTEEQILEGKEEDYQVSEIDYPCRFEHTHFDKGAITMNGDVALKYARSRHSTNPAERGDFARAKRQQQVILAVRNKALSMGTLLNPKKIADLYGIYQKYFATDITVSDAQVLFSLAIKANISEVKTAVLTNSSIEDGMGAGLLYAPADRSPYGGKWVVVPKGGSFAGVHAFVQKLLFGN
ncbi:hypothetical protein COT49_03455 [candidate division WWE3 bacterium CG08_land_8_20_14_0_20_40_13]|uniref:Cell envelope-related transcriptional attenuator domain-containing protein n=1 Tax=candidate division WWE3 bacterium CG08_land_8_20_14_0_20_40_13 TaxID=1975084 RepID=A0A2H0XFC2_UNCKA|nr:MAG: hypothetical protein COT49_03455 [candidate division WWE3 bacterium CG08_land_8_20_14_0_20_40_13]